MPKSKSKPRSVTLFEQVYEAIIAEIDERDFTAADLMHFATLAIQLVDKYPELSGPAKKDMVVRLAERIVQDYVPEEEKDTVLAAVRLLLPGIIDTVIAATKGQLGINLKKKLNSCSCFK